MAANHLRLDQALAVARRGLAMARSSDDDVALAVGLDGLKTVLYFLGELDELAEVCAELEPLVRRQGDLNLLQWTVFESAQCPLGGGDGEPGPPTGCRRRWRSTGAADTAPTGPGSWLTSVGWRRAGERSTRASSTVGGRSSWPSVRVTRGGRRRPGSCSARRCSTPGTRARRGPCCVAAWATGMAGGAARRCLNAALLAEASGEPAMATTAHRLLEQIHAPAGSAWLQGVDAYLALARPGRTR